MRQIFLACFLLFLSEFSVAAEDGQHMKKNKPAVIKKIDLDVYYEHGRPQSFWFDWDIDRPLEELWHDIESEPSIGVRQRVEQQTLYVLARRGHGEALANNAYSLRRYGVRPNDPDPIKLTLRPNQPLRAALSFRYCVEHVFPWHYRNRCLRLTVEQGDLVHSFVVDALESSARYLLNVVGHDLGLFFSEYTLVQFDKGRIVLNENVPLLSYGVEDRNRRPLIHHHTREYLRRNPYPNHFQVAHTNYNTFSAKDQRTMDEKLRRNRPFLYGGAKTTKKKSFVKSLVEKMEGKKSPSKSPGKLSSSSSSSSPSTPFDFVEIRLRLRGSKQHQSRNAGDWPVVARFVFHVDSPLGHVRDAVQLHFLHFLEDSEIFPEHRFWRELGLLPTVEAEEEEETVAALVLRNRLNLYLDQDRFDLLPFRVHWGDLAFSLLVPADDSLHAAVWSRFERYGLLEHSSASDRRLHVLVHRPGPKFPAEALMDRKQSLRRYGVPPFASLTLTSRSIMELVREERRQGLGLLFVFAPNSPLELHVKVPRSVLYSVSDNSSSVWLHLDVDPRETPASLWQILDLEFGIPEWLTTRREDDEGGVVDVRVQRRLRVVRLNKVLRGNSRHQLGPELGLLNGDKLIVEEAEGDGVKEVEVINRKKTTRRTKKLLHGDRGEDDDRGSEGRTPSLSDSSDLNGAARKKRHIRPVRELVEKAKEVLRAEAQTLVQEVAAHSAGEWKAEINELFAEMQDADKQNLLGVTLGEEPPPSEEPSGGQSEPKENGEADGGVPPPGKDFGAELNKRIFGANENGKEQNGARKPPPEPSTTVDDKFPGFGTVNEPNPDTLPEEFDASEAWPECAHVINTVEDQANCGSCWAVSGAHALSDRFCIALISGALDGLMPRGEVREAIEKLKLHFEGHFPFMLSARDLLACSSDPMHRPERWRNDGCDGGSTELAWMFMRDRGLVTGGPYRYRNSCQPYPFSPSLASRAKSAFQQPPEERTPVCEARCTGSKNFPFTYAQDKFRAASIGHIGGHRPGRRGRGSSKWGAITEEEAIRWELLRRGPVQASMRVFYDFYHYRRGVYRHVAGEYLGGHAVRIVGWGRDPDSGLPFWRVANSWGDDWGENGFFRIVRGRDACNIETWALDFGTPDVRNERVVERLRLVAGHFAAKKINKKDKKE